MSVVPELERPVEAFKARGITDGENEKGDVDGKAKCVVDRSGLAAVGEVVNNSSEERNSCGEVFKEGPSEKGCLAVDNVEGDDDEREKRGRKKLLSFSDEVQKGGEKRGKYEEEELRRRRDSDRRREEEGKKEEEGRKRREDRRRRSCQVNTGEFSQGMPGTTCCDSNLFAEVLLQLYSDDPTPSKRKKREL